MSRNQTFAQAINEGLHEAMAHDDNVICYGLGATDPKRIFGTTVGLVERFGERRVFDMPTSENAMTGIGIGASLNGIRPVMTHQRLDFFLLAFDQLINNAAKWHFMFGGQSSVPITIRLIMGRGWGQGPTHSQNLQAMFAHVPGLKVVMPTTPEDAKGLLIDSIFDDDPVVFLEHRWLHNQQGQVPEGFYRKKIGFAELLRAGSDITIVSMSYMTVEALWAIRILEENGVSVEHIDLKSANPIDWPCILSSVRKTGRVLALDTGVATGSIAGEIVARVGMECFDALKCAPARIALPDIPTPTSFGLTKSFYPRADDIVARVAELMGLHIEHQFERKHPHDVPGDWFKGPF